MLLILEKCNLYLTWKSLPFLELTQIVSELITDDATSEKVVHWKIFVGQSKSTPEHEGALSKWIKG